MDRVVSIKIQNSNLTVFQNFLFKKQNMLFCFKIMVTYIQ